MKKLTKTVLLSVLLLFMLHMSGFADTITGSLTFSSDHISYSRENGFDLVTYTGKSVFSDALPGEPKLPKSMFQLVIPEDAIIKDIRITHIAKGAVKTGFTAFPAQPQYRLDTVQPEFVSPLENIYLANKEYPYTDTITYLGDSLIRGYRLAQFGVTLFTYNPVSEILYFMSGLEYEVEYEIPSPAPESSGVVESLEISDSETAYPAGNEVFKTLVQVAVENKSDIETLYPATTTLGVQERQTPAGKVDFLIITSQALESAFLRYATSRQKATNMIIEVVTVEDIYTNYNEPTPQLEIKRCIQYYISNKNTNYVMLGGDDTIVPAQMCFIKDGTEIETAPSDLFYSCFDDVFDWNKDGDGDVGESTDTIDFSPDIFLGRLPIRTALDVDNYQYKMEQYLSQLHTNDKHMKNIYMTGVKLWNTGDAEAKSNKLFSYLEPVWDGLTKETLFDNEPYVSLTAELLEHRLSRGLFNAVNMNTHGGPTSWSMEIGESFGPKHAAALQGQPYGVLTTMACHTNAFDDPRDPCLGEAFIRNRVGGPVVYIGGTREGYGDSSLDVLGDSLVHIKTFYMNLLDNNVYNYLNTMGIAFAQEKQNLAYTALSGADTLHWVHLSHSYMGDPTALFAERREGFWWEEIKNTQALDVGAGSDGSVWIIGSDSKPYKLTADFRWISPGSFPYSAKRIDVDPQGNAWVVTTDKKVYQFDGTSWNYRGENAVEITVGGDGTAYILSETWSNSEGYTVFRHLDPGWQDTGGKANRISADAGGNVYTVKKTGDISFFDGETWSHVPGRASDIGVGPNGTIFITGYESTAYGHYVYRLLDGVWQKIFGEAVSIDVDHDGTPWKINRYNKLYMGHLEGNMVTNSDMHYGTDEWKLYTQNGATAQMTGVNKEIKIDMTNGGTYSWSTILAQTGMRIENGETYTLSYWAKENNAGGSTPSSQSTVSLNAEPWTEYGYKYETFTNQYRRYSHTFTMNKPTDNNAILQICVGGTAREVYIDAVALVKHLEDTQAPTTPKETVNTSTFTSFSIAWSPATDNEAVAGYEVRDGNTIFITKEIRYSRDIPYLGKYNIFITALDSSGNRSDTIEIKGRTQYRKQAYINRWDSTITDRIISPVWKGGTTEDLVRYKVECTDAEDNLVETIYTTGKTCTFTGLTPDSQYNFALYSEFTDGYVLEPTFIQILWTQAANSNYASWDASSVYTGGDMVSHDGKDWRAKWWTQGDEPGVTASGVWEEQ